MRTGRLAIFLSGIEREYQHEISMGIQEEARARGYATYFICCHGRMDNPVPTSEEAEANIFRLPDLNTFDGAIVLRATVSYELALKALNEKLQSVPNLPMAFIDERIDGMIGVGFEDAHCVQDVTEHFIVNHGARRLCFVSGVSNNSVSLARQHEFEQVLKAHNLPFTEEQIFCGDFIRDGGARAAAFFTREGAERPDAIICANDDMALGLCEALMNSGLRIPEDIGVAGFDSIVEASTLIPTLTTVRRPVRRAGREAVRLLDEKLNGLEPPEWTALQNEVIYGQSCGCGHADDEQKDKCIRRLNRQNYGILTEYARANSLAKRLSGTRDFEDLRSRLTVMTHGYTGEFLYIAAVDEAMRGKDDEASTRCNEGFTANMQLIFGREGKRSIPECRFKTSELFPQSSVPASAVICPLNADGRTLGYVATPLSHTGHFTIYTLLSALGNALENMRLHAKIREYAMALERMYVHDSLTGLLNRQGYAKFAESMYNKAAKNGIELMIICADMDSLKRINDSYGHIEGDTAIKALAECIQRSVSEKELCIHLCGDEFMLLGLGFSEESMAGVIKRIEEELEQHNAASGKPYQISASFGGYVAIPDEDLTLERMSILADDAMYREKKRKRESLNV